MTARVDLIVVGQAVRVFPDRASQDLLGSQESPSSYSYYLLLVVTVVYQRLNSPSSHSCCLRPDATVAGQHLEPLAKQVFAAAISLQIVVGRRCLDDRANFDLAHAELQAYPGLPAYLAHERQAYQAVERAGPDADAVAASEEAACCYVPEAGATDLRTEVVVRCEHSAAEDLEYG